MEIPSDIPVQTETVKRKRRSFEKTEDSTKPTKKVKLQKKKKNLAAKEEPKKSVVPLVRHSDDPPPKPKVKWVNKQRVLVFCSHGIRHLSLALMKDFLNLLPHSKSEPKMDKKDPLYEINEICESRNCNKCLFFEQKRNDLYLWVANVPNGPSAKFLVESVKTMGNLQFIGNCLKGSEKILSFNTLFESQKHLAVLKELFTQVFQTPRAHPHSKPFLDHTLVFSATPSDQIWFRNYQLVDGGAALEEIGPRMTLTLIKIFDGSFGGKTLYSNPKYITPSVQRRQNRLQKLTQEEENEESSDED